MICNDRKQVRQYVLIRAEDDHVFPARSTKRSEPHLGACMSAMQLSEENDLRTRCAKPSTQIAVVVVSPIICIWNISVSLSSSSSDIIEQTVVVLLKGEAILGAETALGMPGAGAEYPVLNADEGGGNLFRELMRSQLGESESCVPKKDNESSSLSPENWRQSVEQRLMESSSSAKGVGEGMPETAEEQGHCLPRAPGWCSRACSSFCQARRLTKCRTVSSQSPPSQRSRYARTESKSSCRD